MAAAQLVIAVAALTACAQDQPSHAHHSPPPADAGTWVRYHHATAGFSLEHPGDWRVDNPKQSVSVHMAHPTKAVHLFVAAYDMNEGSLEQFAEMKFAAQADLFKALGPARSMEGPDWKGLVQEAETIRTEGGKHARRLMLCAGRNSRYVSLTLYLEPDELAGNGTYYERIFTSLRFGE